MRAYSGLNSSYGHLLRGFLASGLIVAVIGLPGLRASAGPAKPASEDTRLTALESQVAALTMALRALNKTAASQGAQIASLEKTVTELRATLASQDSQIAALQTAVVAGPDPLAEIASLKSLLQHFSREDNDLYITGANLHIVNGAKHTWGEGTDSAPVANGLGNLLIGYNEAPSWDAPRNGSHNVVVGPYHAYSSVGCLVAGFGNMVLGGYASVSGGQWNRAEGTFSSVSGGHANSAMGVQASVSGGQFNRAKGGFSTVSGGQDNEANFDGASVSGGSFNRADGVHASVSGGMLNTASGSGASVSGGCENQASGTGASVGGGFERSAAGDLNWATGPYSADQ